MKLARVAGTVVTTISAPFFDGRKLLLCDYLTPDGTPEGGYVVAVDTVDAGAGQTVLVLDEGNSARQATGGENAPVRAVVVGIVDAIEYPGNHE
ncbi:MAG: EutN/CcmL family microcompartment protein [Ardenticatenaceae bacterium]|nr:EutN/CcmL family microcompartment protein [Ardenticatenaceae bacterium]HBY93431.1 hypothetical protein [Chloroflexota bacterium]